MQRVVEREEKPGKGGRTSGQVDLSAAEHVLVETHYLPTSALSSEDLRDWAVVRRVWRGEHVVHMCSLFHAFILSQLWTVYLEYINPTGNTKEEQLLPPSILLDFWVKVTPGILQLVSHSKVINILLLLSLLILRPLRALIIMSAQVLAEMVNLHFLSLMEALLECRFTPVERSPSLMPSWSRVTRCIWCTTMKASTRR